MKLRKILALLLVITMMTAVFTSCNQTVKSPLVSDDVATETPETATPTDSTSASPEASALNYEGAYAALDPMTVMLTIDGKDILWDELFYYISYGIYDIVSSGGEISDWSANYQDDVTYKDFVLKTAVNYAVHNEAINYGAKQLNVALTDQDKADMQADYDAQVSDAGSEEAFLTLLQGAYTNKEIYTMLTATGYLSKDCFTAMYGEQGSKLTDEEVADNTAADGYLMAKQILMLTSVYDESGNATAMTDAEKAQVKEKMEDVLKQLKAYTGDDFDAFFDQLMNQYSDDTSGLAAFPDGFLFQEGNMVSPFEEATKALQIGQLSQELVETTYGYHIIYRIPINYDVTPTIYADSGEAPLRYITAINMYNAVIETWGNSLNVVYSDQYKSLDFAKLFAAG